MILCYVTRYHQCGNDSLLHHYITRVVFMDILLVFSCGGSGLAWESKVVHVSMTWELCGLWNEKT